jgi:hypothetical protein
VDAVRGDDDIGRDARPVCKCGDCLVVVLLEADAPVVNVHHIGGQTLEQELEQVGAVHAINFDVLARSRRPPRSDERAVELTELRVRPARSEPRDVVAESEPPQHADSVRVQRHAGANFFDRRRLLVQSNVDASLQ